MGLGAERRGAEHRRADRSLRGPRDDPIVRGPLRGHEGREPPRRRHLRHLVRVLLDDLGLLGLVGLGLERRVRLVGHDRHGDERRERERGGADPRARERGGAGQAHAGRDQRLHERRDEG